MSQDVYIDCKDYRVILTGKDRETFERVTKEPWAKNKSGEDLVALILSVVGRDVSQVTRKNLSGQLRDGDNGEPAHLVFEEARVVLEEHYRYGRLNDGINGEPAIQKFFGHNSRLVKAERYKDGLRNDGTYGEPAIKRWNGNGKVGRIERYKNGLRNDGERGEPAIQEYNDDGQFVQAIHYKDGKFVKDVDIKPPSP
jgi:hypothetical protein